jgi:hypothetical protein
MKTSELLDYIVAALVCAKDTTLNYSAREFESWLRGALERKDIVLPNGARFDLSSVKGDFIQKIMNKVSLEHAASLGSKPWDKEYVRSSYGFKLDGVDFVYYPSRNPKRLVVNFSSMGKDRFDRYSRHWDETQKWDSDSAYLYFKDDSFMYYLGDDAKPMSPTYVRVIRSFMSMNALKPEQCITVGGSMGGYAAIYYAIQMGFLGAVVAAPQISASAAQAHALDNWTRSIRSTQGQWRDLNLFAYTKDKLPYFYLEYGQYHSDRLAVESFAESVRNVGGMIVLRRAKWQEHTTDDVLSQPVVDAAITFFESSRESESLYQTS